jgi:hypothetical protein
VENERKHGEIVVIMTRSAARFWWKKELPKHVHHMYQDVFEGDEWKEYTYAERNAKRKEKQEDHIWEKHKFLRRVPCFIHVYNINNNWFFAGFYIDIWSVHGRWHLNWRTESRHKKFFPMIKQHFNFGLFPFVDDETWFREFCKAYPMKPKGVQNPRGKYLTHCVIDSNNNLINIEIEGVCI